MVVGNYRKVVRERHTLDGKMTHETFLGFRVVEHLFKGRVFKCGTVDITGDPAIVGFCVSDHARKTSQG
jgi:hypothetical protein